MLMIRMLRGHAEGALRGERVCDLDIEALRSVLVGGCGDVAPVVGERGPDLIRRRGDDGSPLG